MEEPITWVVFAGGCALAVPYGRACVENRINASAFGGHIEKLLRRGQLARALKLASCAEMPVVRATRTVLERIQREISAPEERSAAPVDYRSPGAVRDPARAREALRSTFFQAWEESSRPRVRARIPALLGASALLVCLVNRIAERHSDGAMSAGLALGILCVFIAMDLRERRVALGLYTQLEETFLSVALNPPDAMS